jgi:hypothetical protein
MTPKKRSEKRQTTRPRCGRFTPTDDAALQKRLDALGCSFAAMVRHDSIGKPLPRTMFEKQLLERLLAELGKIGSNVNQIAYRYNIIEGRPAGNIEGALDAALRELLEWRTAIMQALGAERNRKPKG